MSSTAESKMNKRITTRSYIQGMMYQPILCKPGDNGERARIWVDVWMDDVKLFDHVIYSGRKDVADDILAGKLFFNSNSQLVDVNGVKDPRT